MERLDEQSTVHPQLLSSRGRAASCKGIKLTKEKWIPSQTRGRHWMKIYHEPQHIFEVQSPDPIHEPGHSEIGGTFFELVRWGGEKN